MQITSEIARLSNAETKRRTEEQCLKLLTKENLCAGEIADLLNVTLNSIRPALSRLQGNKKIYLTKERTDYLCREQIREGLTRTTSAKYAVLVSGQARLF